jgi:HSP20 family protein
MLLPLLRNGLTGTGDPFWTLRRDIDRLFEGFWSGQRSGEVSTWVPPMDVIESDNEIRCTLELPGLSQNDVQITAENGVLTISGEKKYEHDTEEGDTRYTERRYGQFQRSFTLPEHVVSDQISANFENGVLTLVLPKTAQARPRRIQIGVGSGGQRRVEGGEQKRVESGKSERRTASVG